MSPDPLEGKRNAERDARFRLLASLWGFAAEQRESPSEPVEHRRAPAPGRVRDCHRKPVASLVEVKASPGVASLGAVSTCGSPWVCPVCSPKVAAQRQTEVQDAIRAWQARAGSVVLVTLTLKHSRKQRLEDTWDALTKGWATLRNGRGWKRDVEDFGIAGYVRVVEVTHGGNGWHPHVHALLFVRGTLDGEQVERLRSSLYGRWSKKLATLGYRTLEFDKDGKPVAVDVRTAQQLGPEYLADYFAKFGYTPKVEGGSYGLASEVARGDLKKGRKGSRTPWEILEAAAFDEDPEALRLWSEWERVSHGKRQYAWAHGFRESLDLDVMCADREAVDVQDAPLEVVALLPVPSYRELVKDLRRTRKLPGASRMAAMLNKAATLPPEQFRAWLALARIDYTAPPTLEGPAVPLEADPATVPGSRALSWNRLMQSHREAHAIPHGEGTVTDPCRICGGQLAIPEGVPWRSVDYTTGEIHEGVGTGVHAGCTYDGYRRDRLELG